MKLARVTCWILAFGMATPVWADVVGVSSVSTTLDGNGDRTFDGATFSGSATTFDLSNAAMWADGAFTNNAGSYGWNDPIMRDMNSSNTYSGNPDRADHSSAYAGEASNKGTLAEIFGVNNLSHIIDGEDDGAWTLNLFLGAGKYFSDDHNSSTVELALFERGLNSDVGIRGIYATNSGYAFTSGTVVSRNKFAYAGWKLDTLEIDGQQNVGGVGISLEDLGSAPSALIGVQIYAQNGFNGPDLVGVMGGSVVPEPGSLILAAIGGLLFARRR